MPRAPQFTRAHLPTRKTRILFLSQVCTRENIREQLSPVHELKQSRVPGWAHGPHGRTAPRAGTESLEGMYTDRGR